MKRPSYAALNAYLIETRRLFNHLAARGLSDPADFRIDHFHDTVEELRKSGYKNLYDAANNMAVIAKVIDRHCISSVPLNFINTISAPPPRLRHHPSSERNALPSKLPSKEALEAFAKCTNNPISDSEEILLRIIDLHIAMGTRVNETLLIPLDCWIERNLEGADGLPVVDPITGIHHKECGIKYYPEKGFQHNVHWLAEPDVPLARRAVMRLRSLTKQARKVAEWQHENVGRLWDVDPEKILPRGFINRFVETAQPYDVCRIMQRFGVRRISNTYGEPKYRAGDIEKAFLQEMDDQVVFRQNGQEILRLHECLCIGFKGLFRFKERTNSVNWLLPTMVQYGDLTSALGNTSIQSIFERRGLTEADGSKISLRTHQSRHWRNTLYKLGGMTDIQQALAMGRKDVSQNPYYQHLAIDTELASHSAFVEFNSYGEKVKYLRDGIVNGKIRGKLAEAFHSINAGDPVKAQDFLDTHAGGIHVTLWGICTNDFSRDPCQKHLQCFDHCGHLHRTEDVREDSNLRKLLDLNIQILENMNKECADDTGSTKWILEQERKIRGIEMAIAMGHKVSSIPIKVFPNSPGHTKSIKLRRGSSV